MFHSLTRRAETTFLPHGQKRNESNHLFPAHRLLQTTLPRTAVLYVSLNMCVTALPELTQLTPHEKLKLSFPSVLYRTVLTSDTTPTPFGDHSKNLQK
jgi:hypothetical protein